MNKLIVLGAEIAPSKIVCIGRNYVDHIHELGNEIPESMVVFVKPNSALAQTLPSFHEEPLHYEGELCFGYAQGAFTSVGIGLDLTKRQLQAKLKAKGLPWERAKAFNGSVVLSPMVAFERLQDLALALRINGELVQAAGVDLMMYKPAEILAELATFMQLEDGDIVMTGTPKGVGAVNAGDLFEGQVLEQGRVLVSQQWRAQ